MFIKTVKYLLQHPKRTITAVTDDPVEAWIKLRDRYAERQERRAPLYAYRAECSWEERLHAFLGVAWPCTAACEFNLSWPKFLESFQEKGIRVGPMSFGSWNDGDPGLVRAIWCLTIHLRARKVVETGVGHGITSRFVLEAFRKNGFGHLWSVDLPPLDPALRRRVGIAVDNRHRHRWSYIEGSSRRRLPDLFSKTGHIDLFIHDSLHSERNVRFEIDHAWKHLNPGGAIVVDDIDANGGFQSFREKFPALQSFICEAEPLYPDLRRKNKQGLFGIILKPSHQQLQGTRDTEQFRGVPLSASGCCPSVLPEVLE